MGPQHGFALNQGSFYLDPNALPIELPPSPLSRPAKPEVSKELEIICEMLPTYNLLGSSLTE